MYKTDSSNVYTCKINKQITYTHITKRLIELVLYQKMWPMCRNL